MDTEEKATLPQELQDLFELLCEAKRTSVMSYNAARPTNWWRNKLIETLSGIFTRNLSITDEQSVDAAYLLTHDTPRELRYWDDSFGPLWVVRNEFGIIGVVRAKTWEKAYECAVDEIACDWDPLCAFATMEEFAAEEGKGQGIEGMQCRSSGTPSNKQLKSIYADTEHLQLSPLAATDEVYVVRSEWQ